MCDVKQEAFGNGTLSPSFVKVLSGRSGSGAEGVAMMELIHVAAPNSSLVFATGIPSLAVFASAIDALVADGCQIIVDDLQFFTESVFQDGQTVPS